jgi:hypothetical protein
VGFIILYYLVGVCLENSEGRRYTFFFQALKQPRKTNSIKIIESRGIANRCVLWLLILSILSPTVCSRKPTLHLWHRPTCKLQKSHGLVFSSCHVHIRCLTENSLWMTDKLDWMLKNSIGLNKVRTIYGSDNHSALIPTTERCSLHYLLQSNSSVWRETYDYISFKIRKFIVRRTFQIALIHVMERSPLSLQINAQDEEFQYSDGYSFFLDRTTGWLYFRNVLEVGILGRDRGIVKA